MLLLKIQNCSSVLGMFVLDMGQANQVHFYSTFVCRGSELISALLCERAPYLIFAAGLSLFSNHILE